MRAFEQTSPREQSREIREAKRRAEERRELYESESNRRVLFAHSQKGDMKRQHTTARSENKHDGKLGSALSGAKLCAARCESRRSGTVFTGGLNRARRVNRLLASANENEIPLGVHRRTRRRKSGESREIVPRATRTYRACISVSASGSRTVERHARR